MPPSAPWTDLVRKRVEEGPVQYDAVLAEASALVPPGRGYRNALAAMESERRRAGATRIRTYLDIEGKKDQRIRYGQRNIVNSIIHNLIARGRLTSYVENDQRMLALGSHPWSDPIPNASHATQLAKGILESIRDDSMEYSELFEHVKHLVPRDKAINRAIRDRRKNRTIQGRPKETTVRESNITEDDNFNVGARTIFQHSIRALKKSQRILVVGPPKGHRIVARGPRWVEPSR